jgi:hypothetical protein
VQGGGDLGVEGAQEPQPVGEHAEQSEHRQDFDEDEDAVEPAAGGRACRAAGGGGLLPIHGRLGMPLVEGGGGQVGGERDGAPGAAETLEAFLAGVMAFVEQKPAQFLLGEFFGALGHGGDYTPYNGRFVLDAQASRTADPELMPGRPVNRPYGRGIVKQNKTGIMMRNECHCGREGFPGAVRLHIISLLHGREAAGGRNEWGLFKNWVCMVMKNGSDT